MTRQERPGLMVMSSQNLYHGIILLCFVNYYTFFQFQFGSFAFFQGTYILLSITSVPVCIPTDSAEGFPLLYTLANTCYLLYFW